MAFLGKKQSFSMTASVLLGGFVFLYFSLFSPRAVPYQFLHSDSMTYMLNACRMLHGKAIYRDFFQFTPPATETFYFLVFKVFRVHAWIPNVVLIMLGLGIAWLMVVISRNVIPGKAAYLPAALFLVIPFRSQLDPAHHWFSTLAMMAALALVVEKITVLRFAGAGALCGLAMCFTQSTGLPGVLALALYLLWLAKTHRQSWLDFRKSQLFLWSSFSVVVVVFNAYFVFEAGLRTFLNDTVVFGLRYWSSEKWNRMSVYMTDMPTFHPWYKFPALAIYLSVYLLTPLIYILFLVRYRQQKANRPSEQWDRLVLIAIVGTMLFLGVAAAPGWLRLCVVAPFGLILFVWFLITPGRSPSLRTTIAWMIVVVIALGECGERQMGWRRQVRVPIGRVIVFNRIEYKQIRYLIDHTKPGDYFFGNVKMNFLLSLRDPSPIPYVTTTDYTRPQQVLETIQGLEHFPVKYVFWWSGYDLPPEVSDTTNHLAPLRAYLVSHYQLVKSLDYGNYTFWRKRNAPLPVPSSAKARALPQGRHSAPSSASLFASAAGHDFSKSVVSRRVIISADSWSRVSAQKTGSPAFHAGGHPQSER